MPLVFLFHWSSPFFSCPSPLHSSISINRRALVSVAARRQALTDRTPIGASPDHILDLIARLGDPQRLLWREPGEFEAVHHRSIGDDGEGRPRFGVVAMSETGVAASRPPRSSAPSGIDSVMASSIAESVSGISEQSNFVGVYASMAVSCGIGAGA
jgi:hypothetical protein